METERSEQLQDIDPSVKVLYLSEILGGKLTAYIGGAKDTATVTRWKMRQQKLTEGEIKRFNAAFEWVQYLDENKVSADEIKALAIGENMHSGQGLISPSKAFRNIDKAESPQEVIKAAIAAANHILS
ncbi:MAG: hypothetical protein A2152_00550 [Candidatus Levybacteria bacterium RBG_16_35_6]|nr:MAG: hypothetical protein A2152_00550 [Candidatus Levybacteria bacterium RBG_16_35_6]